MPFAGMDGPIDYHTEWSKSDGEKQTSNDIAYMWSLKNDAVNLFTKQSHISRKQTYGYQRGKVGGINWEIEINTYTLLLLLLLSRFSRVQLCAIP